MSTPRRLIAIVNANAGDSEKKSISDRVEQVFAAQGIDARMVLAGEGSNIADAARAAVREQPDVIVAGGGDGTVNCVAAHLVDTPIVLGVLPLGTLNHFAKALQVPLDPEAAANLIVTGRVARVDVGEVNGRVFVNNSSLGLYPSLVLRREMQQEQLGRGKWAAAAWAALTLLRRHAVLQVGLDVDGEQMRRRTAMVFIGNNVYEMSGLRIGDRARLDAGLLSLYVSHRSGRRGLLALAMRALLGRESAGLDELAATEITIAARRARLPVAIDGEVFTIDTPLHYRIRPRALRVIVGTPDDAATPDAG